MNAIKWVDQSAFQTSNKVIIQYYRRNVYGKTMEYVLEAGDAQIITQLTGKRTIDSVTRELLRDLSRGLISFQEVIAP